MTIKSWMRSVILFFKKKELIRFIDYFFKVDAFLEAHDSGLTDADKKVADGKLFLYCYS